MRKNINQYLNKFILSKNYEVCTIDTIYSKMDKAMNKGKIPLTHDEMNMLCDGKKMYITAEFEQLINANIEKVKQYSTN